MNNTKIIEFNQRWIVIQNGITKLKAIIEGKKEDSFTSEEYMNLYSTIYDMCTQRSPNNYAEPLYNKYKEAIEEYINATVLPALREQHDEFLLGELMKKWAKHKVMVKWLSHFFHYLDRYYIPRAGARVLQLKDYGHITFRDLVYEELKNKVGNAIIKLVGQERNGNQIARGFLKNAVNICVEMGMGAMDCYENDIEAPLLKDTSCYYSREASNWFEKDSCPEYLLKAEECLRKEHDRVSHYLHESTETKLTEVVEYELLAVYSNGLLEMEHSGCRAMLRDDKVEDLSRMYRLFSKVPKGLEPAANIFRQHIIDEGMVLVQQADDSATNKAENEGGSMEQVFIGNLLKLHEKCMTDIELCFLNDSLFHKAQKDAFDVFCNKAVAGRSTAEILATFSDNILKKGGSEKLSDEAIQETLDKVVKLLAYINDKDLLAEFYRKKLSRRLLFDKSANDDHEKHILTNLKQQCGGQFTSNMEGMLTDLTLSKENQNHYHEYLKDKTNPGIDFSVTVLTTGFWPSYKSSDLCLPIEMVKCIEVFKEFYQTKTKHRKLTWIYSLGTCNIIGKFDAKPIELIVGTYQGAVLLLFNSANRLSYSEIKTQLNLGDGDLVRLLQSLTGPKYKILIKEPATKLVTPSDIFEFNGKFTDKMRRIRIPLPPPVGDERKKTVEDVDKDRRYVIDATIVRIMKSRKVLGHQQLVLECVEQMSHMCKPDIKAIKKRIEDLIGRDYLERDTENPMMYKYLDFNSSSVQICTSS